MKPALVALFPAVFMLTGCIHISPEQQRAYLAPVLAVNEFTAGATNYRLTRLHWPETKEELIEGLSCTNLKTDLVHEIVEMTLSEQTDSGAKYKLEFRGGGSSHIEINLKNF